MKTTTTMLFVTLLLAGNAGWAQAANGDQAVDGQAPTTTSQRDLHSVKADYAVLQGARQATPASAAVAEMPQVPVAGRFVNTLSPLTTNQADLHSVEADYQTVQAAGKSRADRVASKYARN